MQLAYITPNDEMQIVDKNYDGSAEVYNFKNIYSSAHSHIHYDSRGRKTVYRNLNNPEYDTHKFYPRPEDAQYGAIQRNSIYDFDYTFEQLRSLNLDQLSKSQLEEIRNYLQSLIQEQEISGRTR